MKKLNTKEDTNINKNPNQYVVFTLDEQRYALRLSAVDRTVRVVEITTLPKSPGIVSGVVNVRGKIIPVINVRSRFLLPEREMDLNDQMIIANTSKRTVALIVDSVEGVIESSDDQKIGAEKILAGTDYVEGVIKREDGLILIHDLDTFLSLDEEKNLDAALKARKGEK